MRVSDQAPERWCGCVSVTGVVVHVGAAALRQPCLLRDCYSTAHHITELTLFLQDQVKVLQKSQLSIELAGLTM